MSEFAFFVDGLEDLDLNQFNRASIRRAAAQAINKITRDTRAAAARAILSQVALPASYVAPAQGRLAVAKTANPASLEGRIRARGRATSLARFATGGARPSARGGVYVSVKPGSSRFMRRAFLIRLRSGNAFTDTQFNLGLAMRLRPGERLQNKVRSVKMGSSGLYLLYGPSVSQIFLANSGKGVASEMAPKVARDLEAEFIRLMGL